MSKAKQTNGCTQKAEMEARTAKRGLWQDLHAIPPWEYRAAERGKR